MIKRLINNSLFQNTGIYTLTSIINAAIPLLLLPVLTRYLTPEDYGLVSMFALLTSIASPFIGISINGAISRQFYEKSDVNLWEYVFNCLLILVVNTLFVGMMFFAFANPIAELTSFPARALWMVVVYVFSQFIINIIMALWQVQKKALLYGLFSNMRTATNLFLSIVFVVVFQLGWAGRIYAQLGTLVLFAIITVIILLRNEWIEFRFNRSYVKHALMFGIPLIPHALSGTIISMTDRFFITNMVGLAATGIYTVGYQVGSLINLIANSFNNAYVPWLYERLKKNEIATKIKIVKFTYVYFIGIISIALVLGVVAPMFLKVFLGKSFSGSSIYVIWVALGYAFNAMYLMVVNYIFYAQKNGILAGVTFFTAIINIVLNYFFIKAFGAIGAAQATTVVFFIKFVLVWKLSAKVHKMPWNFIKHTNSEN